jgi:putative endonuclease
MASHGVVGPDGKTVLAMASDWTVYIIRCSDGTFYTGVTTDVERRFMEHAGTVRGARYFSGRRPECVVYREAGHTRSSAHIREAAIKRFSRAEKIRLIESEGCEG